MLGRLSAGLVIALVTFSASAQDGLAASTKTQAKTVQKVAAKTTVAKRTTKRLVAHRARGKSYLVPPPPPYAPSILPEIAYRHARGYRKPAAAEAQVEKVESAYAKVGVQAAEGYEDPEPVKKNPYVTTWNNKG